MPHPFDRYHALFTTEELDPAHVQAMFRLRKRLFVDHCGWMLATIGDVEREQFETWYNEHCLLFSGSDLIRRLPQIKTSFHYLTHSHSPHLTLSRFPLHIY